MKDQRRQGDILFIPVEKEPKKGKQIKSDPSRGIVIAEGEATGHLHRIQCPPPAAVFYNIKIEGGIDGMLDRYLHVRKPVSVIHDEHGPIDLPADGYIVRRQREYTPDGLRTVAD